MTKPCDTCHQEFSTPWENVKTCGKCRMAKARAARGQPKAAKRGAAKRKRKPVEKPQAATALPPVEHEKTRQEAQEAFGSRPHEVAARNLGEDLKTGSDAVAAVKLAVAPDPHRWRHLEAPPTRRMTPVPLTYEERKLLHRLENTNFAQAAGGL